MNNISFGAAYLLKVPATLNTEETRNEITDIAEKALRKHELTHPKLHLDVEQTIGHTNPHINDGIKDGYIHIFTGNDWLESAKISNDTLKPETPFIEGLKNCLNRLLAYTKENGTVIELKDNKPIEEQVKVSFKEDDIQLELIG